MPLGRYLTNLDACSRRHAGHLARHLNGPLIALSHNDHEAANQLLGLGKRPVGHAGRADDFPTRLEAAAHIQDFRFELLLPRCERGLHLLHLGRTRLLLFAGRAAANEQIALCRHRSSLLDDGMFQVTHYHDERRNRKSTLTSRRGAAVTLPRAWRGGTNHRPEYLARRPPPTAPTPARRRYRAQPATRPRRVYPSAGPRKG